MPSVNSQIVDLATGHSVNLARVEAGVRGQVLRHLRNLESDLVRQVRKVDPTKVRTAFQQARLNALLQQTRGTIASAYGAIHKATGTEYRNIAKMESDMAREMINAPVGVDLASVALSPEMLKNISNGVLIAGAPSKEWWSGQSQSLQKRFTQQMRMGISQGETVGQLSRRVRGSKAADFRDGIMKVTKHQADSLVRSSVMAVTNAARIETYSANTDVIKAVQQISTLDGRTTQICMAYSGKVWRLPSYRPFNHSLAFQGGPPRHWGCRSTLVPVTRTWKELGAKGVKTPAGGHTKDIEGLFNRQLLDKGFTKGQAKKITMRAQASMDGYVPAEWDFEHWLLSKSDDFQRDVLGKSKFELWKKGKIKNFDELVDQTGRPMTVAELKAKYGARKVPIHAMQGPLQKPEAYLAQHLSQAHKEEMGDWLRSHFARSRSTVRVEEVTEGKIVTWDSEAKIGRPYSFFHVSRLAEEAGHKWTWELAPEKLQQAATKTGAEKVTLKAVDVRGVTNPITNIGKLSEPTFNKLSTQALKEIDGLTKRHKVVGDWVDQINVREIRLWRDKIPGATDELLGAYQDGVVHIKSSGARLGSKLEVGSGRNWFVGDDFGSRLRHELGHHFYDNVDSLTSSRVRRADWLDLYKGESKEFWRNSVGRYAGDSAEELFSECFSAYTSPLYKASKVKLPRNVESFLDDLLGSGRRPKAKPASSRAGTAKQFLSKHDIQLSSSGKFSKVVEKRIIGTLDDVLDGLKRDNSWLLEDLDRIQFRRIDLVNTVRIAGTGSADEGLLAYHRGVESLIRIAGKDKQLTSIPTFGRVHSVGEDIATTFRHEIGHAVRSTVGRRAQEKGLQSWASLYSRRSRAWWKNNLCEYGATADEAFAEAFAGYLSPFYGQAKKKLPKEIENWFEKVLGKPKATELKGMKAAPKTLEKPFSFAPEDLSPAHQEEILDFWKRTTGKAVSKVDDRTFIKIGYRSLKEGHVWSWDLPSGVIKPLVPKPSRVVVKTKARPSKVATKIEKVVAPAEPVPKGAKPKSVKAEWSTTPSKNNARFKKKFDFSVEHDVALKDSGVQAGLDDMLEEIVDGLDSRVPWLREFRASSEGTRNFVFKNTPKLPVNPKTGNAAIGRSWPKDKRIEIPHGGKSLAEQIPEVGGFSSRPLRDVVRHEFGHTIEHEASRRAAAKGLPTFEEFFASKSANYWKTNISVYGSSSWQEAFAESFRILTNPKRIMAKNKVPKSVREWFAEVVFS